MENLTVDRALKLGIEAHQAGKISEADQYYTAILNVSPQHPDANHNMGVLAFGIGKVAESIPFFAAAVEANPAIEQFWVSLIKAKLKLEEYDDVTQIIKRAIAVLPDSKQITDLSLALKNIPELISRNEINECIRITSDLIETKEFQLAIDLIVEKLNAYPDSAELLVKLAYCYTKTEALEQARSMLDRVNQSYRGNADYLENEANYNLKKKNYIAAESFARVAAEKFPDNAKIFETYAGCLFANKKHQKAIEIASIAIGLDSTEYRNYAIRGIAYHELGQNDDAYSNLKVAHKMKPSDQSIWALLVQLEIKKSDYNETLKLLYRLLEIDAESEIVKDFIFKIKYNIAVNFDVHKITQDENGFSNGNYHCDHWHLDNRIIPHLEEQFRVDAT